VANDYAGDHMIVCIPGTVFQDLNLYTYNRTDTPHHVECSCSQNVNPHSWWRIRCGSETATSVSTTSQTRMSQIVDLPIIAHTSPTPRTEWKQPHPSFRLFWVPKWCAAVGYM